MTRVKAVQRRIVAGLGAACCGLAFAQGFVPPSAPAVALEPCVGGEAIELRAGSDSALLDEADRAEVQAAMLQRYPAFGRDGTATSAIVLWRRPDGSWVYLALKNHPDKPGKVCSAASFSAGVFGFTAGLLQKYFYAGRT